jgi:hypothetical protein
MTFFNRLITAGRKLTPANRDCQRSTLPVTVEKQKVYRSMINDDLLLFHNKSMAPLL